MNKTRKEKRKKVPQPRGVKSGKLPEQPCVMSFCGLSKSGKTTLLKDTLVDETLLGGYFHTIIFFSPTADCDSTITAELDIPEENVYTDFEEDDMKEIIDSRRTEIKKKGYNKVARTNRVLFIVDDCIAKRGFLNSKTMLDLAATVRHLLISVFFCIQSFNKIPRAVRINFRGIAFFESNAGEVEVLLNEHRAPSLKREEFRQLIHYANKEPYSFLFVNVDAPFQERYRKNFNTILELK